MRICLIVLLACCAARAQSRDEPLGHAGGETRDEMVEEYLRAYGYEDADFEPVADRWRIGFPRWDRTAVASENLRRYDSPYALGRARNPYRQNVWKGDYPLFGQDLFLVATLISDTTVEWRDLPTPSAISTAEPDSPRFFGSGEQFFLIQNFVTSFEIFKGHTAFKPPDWLVRITPVFNVNYLDVRENNAVNIDVRAGTTRTDSYVGLQEAFLETHLADLSANYDFVSLTVGIQQFVADPRALLFFDNNLGARLAANWDNNRSQANLALFYMLEKDTNSELNTFDSRDQWVMVANFFRQDLLWLGYTLGAIFAWNRDDGAPHIDNNGAPVRPPPLAAATRGRVDAFYLGFSGDGHIGRLNITHEFFYVLGRDRENAISGRDVDIDAQMLFLELSYDIDWLRPRFSFLWASGDDDPFDGNGRGFDGILDDPTVAGGLNSYWVRQSLRLAGTSLNTRRSVYPNLRPNKFQGQANFVNPGLVLINAGVDVDLAVEWRGQLNVSYLMFAETGALEPLLNQNDISRSIGWETTLGLQYRPNANNNIQVFGGASALFPGAGYSDVYESGSVVYSFFLQLLLIY